MLSFEYLALSLVLVSVLGPYCCRAEPSLLGACAGGVVGSSDNTCDSYGSVLPSNSTVAFDIETSSGYGSTRLHGSSLSIAVDLIEISAAGGVMRLAPTHAEFADNYNNVWAKSYGREGTVSLHHNDQLVMQLSHSGKEGAGMLVNGAIIADDVALRGQEVQQLRAQLCAQLSDPQSFLACRNEGALTTVTALQALLAISSTSGGGNGGNVAPAPVQPKVAASATHSIGIDLEQTTKLIKTHIASMENDMLQTITKGVERRITEQDRQISVMSAKVGEKVSFTAHSDHLNEVQGRIGKVEKTLVAQTSTADRVTALEAKADKSAKTASTTATTLTQLDSAIGSTGASISRVQGDLAKYEADITKLLSLREKADTRMVALEDKVKSSTTKIDADIAAQTALTNSQQTEQALALAAVDKKTTAFESSVVQLEKDTQTAASTTAGRLSDLDTSVALTLKKTEEAHTMLKDLASSANADLEAAREEAHEYFSNSTAALARSNGILAKVVSEVNGTVYSTGERLSIQIADVRVEVQEGLSAAGQSLKTVESALREEHGDADGALRAELVDLKEEMGKTVREATETLAKNLAEQATDVKKSLVEHNRTTTTALDQAHSRMHASISRQEDQMKDSRKEVEQQLATHSQAVAVESERLSSFGVRVQRLESQTESLGEQSNSNREKLAGMGGQHTSLKESVDSFGASLTALQSKLQDSADSLGSLKQRSDTCEARLEKADTRIGELRERLSKLETLVDLLMKDRK